MCAVLLSFLIEQDLLRRRDCSLRSLCSTAVLEWGKIDVIFLQDGIVIHALSAVFCLSSDRSEIFVFDGMKARYYKKSTLRGHHKLFDQRYPLGVIALMGMYVSICVYIYTYHIIMVPLLFLCIDGGTDEYLSVDNFNYLKELKIEEKIISNRLSIDALMVSLTHQFSEHACTCAQRTLQEADGSATEGNLR